MKKIRNIITPGIKNAELTYFEKLQEQVDHGSIWIDLGCGKKLISNWILKSPLFEDKHNLVNHPHLIGVDIESDQVRHNKDVRYPIAGSIMSIPVKECSCDIISSNMVFEHVRDADQMINEIKRILKPGGTLIFHTPNSWNYLVVLSKIVPASLKDFLIRRFEGRKEDDIFPTYYRMNNTKQIKRLVHDHDMELVDLMCIESTAFFDRFLPLAFAEYLMLRILRFKIFRAFRSNLIVVIRKKGGTNPNGKS
ncbi:MAG: class I SAM-dependent methyltransferase [Chlamydiota bacterium]|nr:class I SAM-dependent methyltransferase [Chlamydiota bacterium]